MDLDRTRPALVLITGAQLKDFMHVGARRYGQLRVSKAAHVQVFGLQEEARENLQGHRGNKQSPDQRDLLGQRFLTLRPDVPTKETAFGQAERRRSVNGTRLTEPSGKILLLEVSNHENLEPSGFQRQAPLAGPSGNSFDQPDRSATLISPGGRTYSPSSHHLDGYERRQLQGGGVGHVPVHLVRLARKLSFLEKHQL